MESVILYLDKPTRAIEKGLSKLCPPKMTVKFLEPVSGPAGTVEEADFILVAAYPVDEKLLNRAGKVKLIQKTGTGYENIDVSKAAERGIPVATTPGANAIAVAELVILYILALYRKLVHLDKTTKEGKWEMWKHRHVSFELYGKRLGIIGMGQIGRALAERAIAFGVHVDYYDIVRLSPEVEGKLGVTYREFEVLLEHSDIISIHVPYNEQTKGLIGKEELAKMKKTAILVNTARGAVVDQEALVEALQEKQLAGAALDVYDREPPEAGSPILRLNNVITTPHIGAGTLDTWLRVISMSMENVERVAKGQSPLHVVNGVTSSFSSPA